MRATIAGLPVGIRMMLGLLTVGLFLFFGLSFLESNRTLAWVFLAFATFRLVVWLRVAGKLWARRSEEKEFRSAMQEELAASTSGAPTPSPEELLAAEDARAEEQSADS